MKFQADLTWKKPLVVLAIMLLAIGQFVVAQNLGTAPQTNVAVQGQTAAQPEGAFLNFINWIGNVIAPVGAGGAVVGAVVSWLTGRGFGRWLFAAAALLAVSGVTRLDRVLDHKRHGGSDLTARPRATGRNCAGSPQRQTKAAGCQRTTVFRGSPKLWGLGRMATPQLLNDIISVLLLLAPSAALLSLVLAGVSLRREGTMTFAIGGGFTKWMFWAVVFLTLQPLLSWFTSFGVAVPLPSGAPGGIATGWLANLQADVAQFVTNFVVQRMVPTLAAFFVLRAVLDAASGQHPLPSILAAMFLLGTQTTYSLLAELQHRDAIRDGRCVGQSVEPPGGDDHADRCCLGASGSDLELRDKEAFPAAGRRVPGSANGFSHLETSDFDDVGGANESGEHVFRSRDTASGELAGQCDHANPRRSFHHHRHSAVLERSGVRPQHVWRTGLSDGLRVDASV